MGLRRGTNSRRADWYRYSGSHNGNGWYGHDDQSKHSDGNDVKLQQLIQKLKTHTSGLDITFLTVEDYPQ